MNEQEDLEVGRLESEMKHEHVPAEFTELANDQMAVIFEKLRSNKRPRKYRPPVHSYQPARRKELGFYCGVVGPVTVARVLVYGFYRNKVVPAVEQEVNRAKKYWRKYNESRRADRYRRP